jgi:hypothetical protein
MFLDFWSIKCNVVMLLEIVHDNLKIYLQK